MDKLSHLIAKRFMDGGWKPMKAGRKSPPISHIMFANDLLLFVEVNAEQLEGVLNCLNRFCSISGQKVSVAKTQIIFSKNVPSRLKTEIVERSGFVEVSDLGRVILDLILCFRT